MGLKFIHTNLFSCFFFLFSCLFYFFPFIPPPFIFLFWSYFHNTTTYYIIYRIWTSDWIFHTSFALRSFRPLCNEGLMQTCIPHWRWFLNGISPKFWNWCKVLKKPVTEVIYPLAIFLLKSAEQRIADFSCRLDSDKELKQETKEEC